MKYGCDGHIIKRCYYKVDANVSTERHGKFWESKNLDDDNIS